MTAQIFTLGTRGSPLALAQAEETRHRLTQALGWEPGRVALKIIRTTGDLIQDRPLADVGGKGLFTKEIDAALLAGEIDAAVHSAKDLPSLMPEGVAIAGFLPREDPRDALISALADTVEGLPQGASFGAASLRRQGQLLRLRPDLRPELLRGNVETRLRKAESGAIGATLLAMAGLKRLGLAHRARGPLDLEAFLPAPGQGAIALTARTADGTTPRCARGHRPFRDGMGAHRRTRLPRRAGGLLPHADRRPRSYRERPGPVPGRGAATRRIRKLPRRRRRTTRRRRGAGPRGRTRTRRALARGRARARLSVRAQRPSGRGKRG